MRDFTLTESGLKFADLQLGQGGAPAPGQTCTVRYRLCILDCDGRLRSPWLEDTSRQADGAVEIEYGAGETLKGIEEGAATMRVGGLRALVIPPDLGFGAEAVGPFRANATLLCELELLAVR